MDLYLRRREIMGFEEYSIGTLRYWWSGADAPVLAKDNKYHWQSRFPHLLPDVPQSSWNSEEKCYELNNTEYGFFGMNVANFTLGNHWRIVFDIDLMMANRSTGQYILDFGSVTQANHAIGIGFIIDERGSLANLNWKMQGNNSNPGTYINISPDLISKIDGQYHRLYGYFEIVDGGDGYDRFQVCINNQKYSCEVQVPKVFYGPTWTHANGYFGRGVTTGYAPQNVKFYDLKIFQID